MQEDMSDKPIDDIDAEEEPDEIPKTGTNLPNIPEEEQSRRPSREFASARTDPIARYSSTKLKRIQLGLASATVGAALGGFVGYSMFSSSGGSTFALVGAFVFWITSHLRNSYGEMCRSLGLALIYLLRRTKDVRRRYRTGVHLKGMCRLGKRQPFPPLLGADEADESPWRYAPEQEGDPEFEMIKSLLCIAFIGSFCGGSIPLLPTWMGSAGGAALFAFFAIAKNSRGDLIRTMGMRVVALLGEAIDINSELRVARKVGVVGGKLLDKMLILDRKHRIKDKILSGASWAYEKVSSTASQVQEDMQEKRRQDEDDD